MSFLRYIVEHYDVIVLGVLVMTGIDFFLIKMEFREAILKGSLMGIVWAIVVLCFAYLFKKPVRKLF